MRGWAALILLGLCLAGCDSSQPPLRLQPGDRVPPLVVVDLDNQPHRLVPAEGKLLAINIWATWCAPCRYELPSLQHLADKLGPERFQLVGVSVDHDDHLVREFLIEREIRFPSLLDRQMAVANGVFGIRAFPSTFFISPDGRLLKVVEG